MNKIWIISDSHFNHPAIINDFEFRPLNYGEQIIKKIQNNVKPGDILIHLGDVIFDNPSELKEILSKIDDGITKILVRGNHDGGSVDFYLNKGFDLVMDEFKINGYMGYNILFSHIPKKDGELPEGYINIHGHLHTNSHHIEEYTNFPERYLCYSAEAENFMPILLHNMLKRLK